MTVYPIFLNNLSGRRCVVIGGDHEAERKAEGLLECGAEVVVVSPDVTPPLRRWADDGRLAWEARAYRRGDLRGAFLAIVSETNPEATAPIWDEAEAEKVLLNAMDDVPHCSFVAGSVIRRGPLVVSISTSGCAPALAVRLRERMEQTFTPVYGDFLDLTRALRPAMVAAFPDFETRRARWYALIDSDLFNLFAAGDVDAACACITEVAGPDVAAAAREHLWREVDRAPLPA